LPALPDPATRYKEAAVGDTTKAGDTPAASSISSEPRPERRGLHFPRPREGSYGFILIGILVTVIAMGLLSERRAAGIVIPLLFLAILFLTMLTSGVPRRTILILTVITPFVMAVGAGAAASTVGSWAGGLSTLVSALLVIACMFFIVRRLASFPVVTLRTILGALCVYLFGGLLFALVYRLIAVMTGEAFFAQTAHPSIVDYIYFSFMAIATVGFGDLTPALDVGKSAVIVEAILGQLYLVVVVALLVSRIGVGRGPAAPSSSEDAAPTFEPNESKGEAAGE
jgi:voltage-gated potassium channel